MIVAALLLASTGCAVLPDEAPQGELKSSRGVGVVSLVADRLWFDYVGMTVFENSERQEPIREWGLDDRIEQATRETLTRAGVARVEVTSVDRTALSKILWAGRTPVEVAAAFQRPEFRDPLLKVARDRNLQHLVVAMPRVKPPAVHRSELLIGLCVKAQGSPFVENPKYVNVFLTGEWALIDVAKGVVLSSTVMWHKPEANRWNAVPPVASLDVKQWRRGFEQVSAEQMESVRKATLQLVPPAAAMMSRLLDPPRPEQAPVDPSRPRT
jgi:hypothetical protein